MEDYTKWILNGTEGIYHVVETIPKSQKLQSKTILDSVHVSNNLLKTDILFMSIPKWMHNDL